jgi:5S rRNA maturation endonuclease (ribonuclease M5)
MTWYTSNKLNECSQQIVLSFSNYSKVLGLNIKESPTMFSGPCPIHDSDNPTAFIMYKNTGVWRCQTRGCHKMFKITPIGLIQGILSAKKYGWTHSDEEKNRATVDEVVRFIEDLQVDFPIIRTRIPKLVETKQELLNISIEEYKSYITYPSDYFIKRGFEPITLYDYLVGTYNGPIKQLKGREAIPIFNNDRSKVIGISGRTPHPKCLVCSGYHSFKEKCPDTSYDPSPLQKWKHNKGFNRSNLLYNWWSAKQHIENSGKVIIVEGPLDVLKLEDAGVHNAVAMFGADMTCNQAHILMKTNPSVITTIMDNDEGGEHAEESCKSQLELAGFKGRLQHFVPPMNDLGDMTKEQIQNFLKIK